MKKCVHWRYSKSVIQIGNVMFSHVLKYNTERLYKFIKKCERERERETERERKREKERERERQRERERENQEKTAPKTFVPKQFRKAKS